MAGTTWQPHVRELAAETARCSRDPEGGGWGEPAAYVDDQNSEF